MDVLVQRDFSGGENTNVSADLIPANAFKSSTNALIDEAGIPFKRGGCANYATTDAAHVLTFTWDGDLVGGHRTVFATASEIGVLDPSTKASTTITTATTPAASYCLGQGMLFLTDNFVTGGITVYAGSLKTSAYTTGTITVTTNSKVVTGTGTTFTTGVDAGMIVTHGGSIVGVVASVDSNTQLTLVDPVFAGYTIPSGTPIAYSASPVYQYFPFGLSQLSALAFIGGRLVGATGSEVRFLPAYDYTAGEGPFSAWVASDFHRMKSASVTAMMPLRETLLVFTTKGIYAIENMELDLTDPAGNVQQRVSHINDQIVAVGGGIAAWNGGLIVPAKDNVYFVTETAAPNPLGAGIRKDYQEALHKHVGAAAVFNEHYLMTMPYYNTTKVLNLRSGGWTTWAGQAGYSSSLCASANDVLVSANPTGYRVLDLAGCFTPTTSNAKDADNTAVTFAVTPRDVVLDGRRKALLKKVRVAYELTDTSPTSSPVLSLSYIEGGVSYSQTPDASPATEENPAVWAITKSGAGIRRRSATVSLSVSAACATMALHGIEWFVRTGGRQ
jgi:hypothetical protein